MVHIFYTKCQFGPYPFNCVNLVHNFSMLCHFVFLCYLLDEKVLCIKQNNKKLIYLPYQLKTVQPHNINNIILIFFN